MNCKNLSIIPNTYTEVAKFVPYEKEQLDLYPEIDFLQKTEDIFITSKGLCFNVEKKVTFISSNHFINSHNSEGKTSWIRSEKGYSNTNTEIRTQLRIDRLNYLNNFVKGICLKDVVYLENDKTYIKVIRYNK